MARRIRLRDRTLKNDISYRGPLSYRWLRVLGWFFLLVAQFGLIARINIKLFPTADLAIGWLANLGDFLTAFPLPLFLLANFASIFQKKNEWKKLLLFYGGVALLLYAAANIIFAHYWYGLVHAFIPLSFWDMSKLFGTLLFGMGNLGLVFNIFIDLFLCSLLFFFMNYTPKRLEGKKGLIFFRLLVFLPIFYEIGSILIKYFVASGEMLIPTFVFFLLTSKPPLMFVAFLALVLILKIEEHRTHKTKRDPNFIEEHRKTNAHSLRFSIIIAITFVIAGLVDLIIFIFGTTFLAVSIQPFEDVTVDTLQETSVIFNALGFGKAAILIIVAPIALLFSYTKSYEDTSVDTLIPLIGIGLIVFVYIEGLFQVVVQNIPGMVEKLKETIAVWFGGGGPELPI